MYRDDKCFDCYGKPIAPGDILESVDPNLDCGGTWRWFACVDEGIYGVAVRDENAHNVGICTLAKSPGEFSDVKNLGNYKKLKEYFEKENDLIAYEHMVEWFEGSK